jgi:xylulokinase
MLGLGTFPCATPVFKEPYNPREVIPLGVNTEHHAVPDRFVSLVYNQGGSVIKWYRDSFASFEHKIAKESGDDIYNKLFAEMPEEPARTIMLPYYSTTGLPDLTTETSGVMTGLRLTTERGEILKGIIESIIFDLRVTFDALSKQGNVIEQLIIVGGGSKSDDWIQVICDILDRPAMRPRIIESGTLGAAIIAGVGSGIFDDYKSAVRVMVHKDVVFMPNASKNEVYNHRYRKFLALKEILRDYLSELSRDSFDV